MEKIHIRTISILCILLYNFTVAGQNTVIGRNQSNTISSNTNWSTLTVKNGGTLTVQSGDTLTIGVPGNSYTTQVVDFQNGSNVTIQSGGVLIVYGLLNNSNNSNGIVFNGTVMVYGNFTGGNGSAVSGTGSFNSTGTITTSGSGSVFGSTTSCTSGPCSGNSLCGIVNTISSTSQSICSENTVTLSANAASGGSSPYTYYWEYSTTSSSSGFAAAPGINNTQNYTSGTLTTTTWFRRQVFDNSGCNSISSSIQVSVSPTVTPSVSISANPGTSICSGKSVTFTASPVNGGSSPSYQWTLNGSNVGTNSSTYTNSTLANNDVVNITMTSSSTCTTANPATASPLTMSVNSDNSWQGSSGSNWQNAANWCGGIPTANTNVIIDPTSNNPVISADITLNSLTISSGASLTIDSTYSVTLNGNWSNSGTFTPNNSTLIFSGTGTQSISGNTTIKNLTINNSSGVTITSGSTDSITVTGTLTLQSGALTTNGNLSVDLTNNGNIAGTGTGSISGNVTIKRTLSQTGWHYVSSPLGTGTVSDFTDNYPSNGSNYYYYNEAIPNANEQVGWVPIRTPSSFSLANMQGIAIDQKTAPVTLDITSTYDHTATFQTPVLTRTTSSDTSADGWHLLGNPYPSVLDWNSTNGWVKKNVYEAIYFYDASSGVTKCYSYPDGINGATQYIPPMQAFWVQASQKDSGWISVNNNARTTTSQSFYRIGAQPKLKITLSNGNLSDETIVRFYQGASDGFDGASDAAKFFNAAPYPSLYTTLDKLDYAINTIAPVTGQKTIPLNASIQQDGNYTLNFSGLESLTPTVNVYLHDLKTGTLTDLSLFQSYSFYGASTDSSNRFELVLATAVVTSSTNFTNASAGISFANTSDYVRILFTNTTASTAFIQVVNTMGEPVAEFPSANISGGEFQVKVNNPGIYIVRVQTTDLSTSEKIFFSGQ